MAEEFLSDLPIFTDSSQRLLSDSRGDREKLRLILIGSANGVREMIRKPHVCLQLPISPSPHLPLLKSSQATKFH